MLKIYSFLNIIHFRKDIYRYDCYTCDHRRKQPEQPAAPGKNGSPLWHRLALVIVMVVSIFMNLYQLGQNGFGNLYYAA